MGTLPVRKILKTCLVGFVLFLKQQGWLNKVPY